MSRRAVFLVFFSLFKFFLIFFPPASVSEQQQVMDGSWRVAEAGRSSAVGHGRRHPAVLLVGLHQGLESGLGFLTAESFLGLP